MSSSIKKTKLTDNYEHQLRQYERIVSATPDGIALIDRDYIYRLVNDAYIKRTGFSYDQIVGHSVAEILGDDFFINTSKLNLDRCFIGETVSVELWCEFPASGREFFSTTYAPYIEPDGTISGAVVSTRSLTSLKQAEETIRASEQKLRALNQVVQTIRQSLDLQTVFDTAVSEIVQLLNSDRANIHQWLPQQKLWRNVAEAVLEQDVPSTLGQEITDHDYPLESNIADLEIVRLDANDDNESQLSCLIIPLNFTDQLWGITWHVSPIDNHHVGKIGRSNWPKRSAIIWPSRFINPSYMKTCNAPIRNWNMSPTTTNSPAWLTAVTAMNISARNG